MAAIIATAKVAAKPSFLMKDLIEQGIDAVIVREEDFNGILSFFRTELDIPDDRIHMIDTQDGKFILITDRKSHNEWERQIHHYHPYV
jgi:hypothetical protein